MGEEKSIIDDELAKAFLELTEEERDHPVNQSALSEATEITDEAAELLSEYKGELNLSCAAK